MYNLRVVVEEVKGFCDLPMKPGDYFEVHGGRIIIPPGKHMCLWALQSLMPMLPLKQRTIAEVNDWVPYTKRICCPDPNGMVIYRIDTIENSGEECQEVRSRMLVDEKACTGCRSCELACSFTNDGEYAPHKARIMIEKTEADGIDRPLVCRQCGNAMCINACPFGALSKDADTKAILVDQGKCVGCRKCAQACPFNSIRFLDGKAHICHTCNGDPACVKKCPTGAIAFGRKGGVK